MNLLILSDGLYPAPNANGLCLQNIMIEMQKRGINIWNVDRVGNPVLECTSGQVIRFYYKNNISWLACKSINDRIVYLFNRLRRYFSYPRCDRKLVNSYIRYSSYVDLSKIDVVLCVCNPVETVQAALQLKKIMSRTKLVIYNLDTVSNVPVPTIDKPFEAYFRAKSAKWEEKVFNAADLIVNLTCHRSHFKKKFYQKFYHKFLFQEVPLLVDTNIKVSQTHDNNDTLKLIYAGAFYNKLRNPDILLSLFQCSSVGNNIDFVLKIYTSSDYCSMINNKMANNQSIVAHEYLGGDLFEQVMRSADILVSLGNKNSCMFPSKIISYMSYLKPIIHVYQDESDVVVDFLSKYPNVLFIDARKDVASNQKLILDFLKNSRKSVSKESIFEAYQDCTPTYNVDMILNYIK